MKILDVPHTNITEMKQSPSASFDKAKESESGVYVFKNNKPYGVVMTTDQYEAMYNKIEMLQESLEEYVIRERLAESDYKTYTEKEALGNHLDSVAYDENDGWE
ncbi:type II toxin-antitoxin system Phd/YefM family antitoxin [Salinicoccus sp. YB14-2]|uniref:type II toxin-antitoxin system Phd/YefM family antitoxin n=1 Tax=Salinicoccus sp. YB14-2 TaxID=1572701 RepID=UPI00068C2317|nr:type II toxin-antitoxin system Phd/YefM family antitoxin [Salinicoccus sp. YB14-2]